MEFDSWPVNILTSQVTNLALIAKQIFHIDGWFESWDWGMAE